MSISVHTATHHSNCHPKAPSIWAYLRTMLSLGRQRRTLATLDDHILSDIGITRSEAVEESRKPMWNVPNHWRN